MFIHLESDDLFGFAGLYAARRGASGDRVESCAIITTAPNELLSPIHNRMPVILAPEDEPLWLDRSMRDRVAAMGCLRSHPSELMEAFPVSHLVGSVRNDSPELIERLEI